MWVEPVRPPWRATFRATLDWQRMQTAANARKQTKRDAKANRLNRQRLARKRLKCSGFPKALKDSHSLRHLRSLALARWRFEWLSGIAPLANDVS